MPDKKPRRAKPVPAAGGRALIFDFDGLILDTEWIEFQAWGKVFEALGLTLDVAEWAKVVGNPELLNVRQALEKRLGRKVDWAPLDLVKEQRHRELSEGLTILPGVR